MEISTFGQAKMPEGVDSIIKFLSLYNLLIFSYLNMIQTNWIDFQSIGQIMQLLVFTMKEEMSSIA